MIKIEPFVICLRDISVDLMATQINNSCGADDAKKQPLLSPRQEESRVPFGSHTGFRIRFIQAICLSTGPVSSFELAGSRVILRPAADVHILQ